MAVREALFFHERLVGANMPFAGFVVNRVHADAAIEWWGVTEGGNFEGATILHRRPGPTGRPAA